MTDTLLRSIAAEYSTFDIIKPEFKNKKIARELNEATLAPDELPIMEIMNTIEGEGALIGTPRVFVRIAGCAVGCKWCFPSTTTILTTEGKRSLFNVAEGDKLYTFDDDMNVVTTTVKKVLSHTVPSGELVKVTYKEKYIGRVNTKSIVCTKDHPFNVKDRGYVKAVDLQPDDIIYHINGSKLNKVRMSDNNPMHDKEVSARVSATQKANYGSGAQQPYERSDSLRQAESLRMTLNNPMDNPASVKKMLASKVYPKSKFEKKFQFLMTARLGHKDLRYCGNGNRSIGCDDSGYLVPDFVFRGTNKLIELYDTTFPHYAQDRTTSAGRLKYETDRTEHYAKHGYEVLFITNEDVPFIGGPVTKDQVINLDASTLKVVNRKVNAFLRNGAKVVSVMPLNTKAKASIQREYDARESAEDPVSVTNFECAPYNHYLIQGLHVHNCDTKHSWSAKGYPVLKIQDIVDKVLSLIKIPDSNLHRVHEVSITGGEPLHYPVQLVQLCHAFHRVSLKVNIETSGVILAPQLFTHFDYVSMDIKTPSSGVNLSTETIAGITHLGRNHTNIYLKVVIASKADFMWLEDNFFTLLLYSKNPIVITPCADTTKKPVNVNAITDTVNMLMGLNKDYNIRIIAQQHKLLSYY